LKTKPLQTYTNAPGAHQSSFFRAYTLTYLKDLAVRMSSGAVLGANIFYLIFPYFRIFIVRMVIANKRYSHFFCKILPPMKKFLSNLFRDGNDINEKSVIGFASFIIMVIFAVVDLITGYMGKPLLINEFIFNSFLIMTLGAFGIASVDKFINHKYENKSSEVVDGEN
jgi:hypothetical protein